MQRSCIVDVPSMEGLGARFAWLKKPAEENTMLALA